MNNFWTKNFVGISRVESEGASLAATFVLPNKEQLKDDEKLKNHREQIHSAIYEQRYSNFTLYFSFHFDFPYSKRLQKATVESFTRF